MYVLDLSHNKLRTILPNVFKYNVILEAIFLNPNKLISIQGSWNNLENLRRINVYNNKSTMFRSDIFRRLFLNSLLYKYITILAIANVISFRCRIPVFEVDLSFIYDIQNVILTMLTFPISSNMDSQAKIFK